MQDTEARLSLVLATTGMVVWDSSIVNGRIDQGEVIWPADGAALIGLPPEPQVQRFEQFLMFVALPDRNRTRAAMQAGVDRRDGYEVQYRVVWPDGAVRWLAARACILCDMNGVPVRTLGFIWDVTARVETEAGAVERDRLAEVTLRAISDGVIRTDAFACVTFMNRAAEALTGWSMLHARGLHIQQVMPLKHEQTGGTLEHAVQKCLRLRQTVGASAHAQLSTREGRHIDIEDAAAPIWSGDLELVGCVLVFRDVSHERRLAHQIAWQARHDPLTGLINRSEFEQLVGTALYRAKEEGQVHALLYMDLDRFKIVNDSCGHAAGDVLLQLLCKLLHSSMREADILARLGGDELGALLLNCPLERAVAIAEHLRRAVSEFRFAWSGRTFEVGVSIGLVEIDEQSVSTTELLLAADQACYLAKEQGRNRVHVYRESDTMLAQKKGELRWVSRLHEAFENKLFRLYTMPIVSLGDGADRHQEILIRMADQSGAMVLPGAFIAAAERYDMMPQIDGWVVKTVLEYIASLDAAEGAQESSYAINLSGLSLGAPGFDQYVAQQLAEHGIGAHRICFEITETAVIANLGNAQLFMERLRLLGCRFALDDFGSGLSSFGYLKSLPVDYLKIDGLFIRDISANPINQALVRAINEVGHVMKLKTVAEYVEDQQTLDMVRALGIDYAQGHAVGSARLLPGGGASVLRANGS